MTVPASSPGNRNRPDAVPVQVRSQQRPRRLRRPAGRSRWAGPPRAGLGETVPRPASAGPPLARYADRLGRAHEIVAVPGRQGSVLVIDRDAATLGDRRLVAHLAPDEADVNARLVCDLYVAEGGRRCRAVTAADLDAIPLAPDPGSFTVVAPGVVSVADTEGGTYRLEPVDLGRSVRELRWRAERPTGWAARKGQGLVSLRDVIGAVQSYEPARAITCRELGRFERDATVSVCVLRGELERMDASRIVLNRRLREVVCAALGKDGLTMNEIAIRCRRTKRDGRGNVSGETSWLARRLGLVPEGGGGSPSPWIHSDVLALIARDGLGIGPHEVELG